MATRTIGDHPIHGFLHHALGKRPAENTGSPSHVRSWAGDPYERATAARMISFSPNTPVVLGGTGRATYSWTMPPPTAGGLLLTGERRCTRKRAPLAHSKSHTSIHFSGFQKWRYHFFQIR
jgi:hypothetical protein